jgi:hypothetical protein
VAIGPFVLFYAAGEAGPGCGDRQREAAADAAQTLYDDSAGELLIGVGAVVFCRGSRVACL